MNFIKRFLLSFSSLLLLTNSSPVPTILDTDIGTDYDDQVALTYILARSDLFDLKLVICSSFNTTARAQIVAKTLSVFKRFHVPIAIGNITGVNNVWEFEWAQDYSLEQFSSDGGTVYQNGEEALANEMGKATSENIYHYIQIGPATSLAHVLESNPSLSKYIRLFAMAGSIYYGYDNTSTPSKEYNVATDIPAAQIMFSSEWLYFGLAPIDCTNFMQFNGLIWQQFLNYVISSSAVRSILTSYAVWYANGGKNIDAMEPFSPGTGTSTMHDVLAAFLAGAYTDVSPTISEILPLVITRDGYTQVNASHGKGVNSCLKFETSNPYLSTTVVGSIVLESIIKPTNKS